jgi:hypothetical protein
MSVANNKNACKNKPWLEALNRAMIRYDGGKVNALNLIADQTVKAAVSGDMWAIKEIGDRVDGKSAQSVTVSGDENNPIAITEIKRTVVKPK